jgi:serine/threonine protein kinase
MYLINYIFLIIHYAVVMHLDLKPANMVYVKVPMSRNGRVGGGGFKRVLKIIDFGGSEFIPKEVDQMEKKRGNSCKIRTVNWLTQIYASPEQKNECENTGQYTV